MAEDARPGAVVTGTFPAPPPFYTHFAPSGLLDLPPELRSALAPPPPPDDGVYRSFGEDRNILTPLPPLPPETASLLPLVPPTAVEGTAPPRRRLLALTRSALLNFLELVHVLATDPSAAEYGPKWEDLRDVMRNAHRGVNMYREWGAREALIGLLEEEVGRRRAAVEGVGAARDEVLRGLGALGGGAGGEGEGEGEGGEEGILGGGGRRQWGAGGMGGENGNGDEEEKEQEERSMWRVLREELVGL